VASARRLFRSVVTSASLVFGATSELESEAVFVLGVGADIKVRGSGFVKRIP
jgi:hypothetical protein